MSSRHIQDRLQDVIDNIDRINTYVRGSEPSAFSRDTLIQDAVERCLQRITEASKHIADHPDIQLPDQDWRAMRRFGDLLRHHYHRIAPETVLSIVQNDLPALRADCLAAIARLEAGSAG